MVGWNRWTVCRLHAGKRKKCFLVSDVLVLMIALEKRVWDDNSRISLS